MLVPATNPNVEEEGESRRVISPFAQTTSTVQGTRSHSSSSVALWVVSSLLVLVIVGIAGYFSYKYLADPHRTMEQFPVDKYMSDEYRSLAGAKFKADLKVSADLGFKPTVGRLMVFTIQNENGTQSDSRPLVVLIPPKLGGIFFEKGQTYLIEMEVGDGGLLNANSCEKE